MIQALLHAKKKLFGASTEVSKQIAGQLNLFQTTEELAKEIFQEQKKITVPSHKRAARKPGVRAEMLAVLPKEIEEYIINPEESCSLCGAELKVIGKKLIRTEVEFIPAKLKVVQIVQQVAKCTECGTGKNENPKDHFQKAAIPSSVLPHSIATASIVAQVMYQKFMMGVPLNRQEKDWYRLGLVLPRSNMAHWVIRCSEEWFTPIYDRIHFELMKCICLHMDETRIQCNKEEGRIASSDSFMWVIRSGASEKIKASYFYYSPSRSGKGYGKVENIKRNLCWAHYPSKMII
jgi:transposase